MLDIMVPGKDGLTILKGLRRSGRNTPAVLRRLNRWMVVIALIVCEELALGLSLSREIAYAHGGNLTIDETPTGQISFTLILSIIEIHGISAKNHSC